MISITQTENSIKGILEPSALVASYGIKPFKLVAFPGELEQLGQPINCATVHVQFKNIEYEGGQLLKFNQCCSGQINRVGFLIRVLHNNLRCYHEVYEISQAIVQALRGRKVAVMQADSLAQGDSALTIKSYKFDKITNGGAMYECSIEVEFQYTDSYSVEN